MNVSFPCPGHDDQQPDEVSCRKQLLSLGAGAAVRRVFGACGAAALCILSAVAAGWCLLLLHEKNATCLEHESCRR